MEDRAREAAKGRLPELLGTATHANLSELFASDTQAASLLQYFARIAEIEGYREVAALLSELSESTSLFSEGHLDFLKRTGHPVTRRPFSTTEVNLATLRDAARLDGEEKLQEAARTAHAEGFPDIASWFESVAIAKNRHAERCEALEEQIRDQ